jgi:hypothetical protein
MQLQTCAPSPAFTQTDVLGQSSSFAAHGSLGEHTPVALSAPSAHSTKTEPTKPSASVWAAKLSSAQFIVNVPAWSRRLAKVHVPLAVCLEPAAPYVTAIETAADASHGVGAQLTVLKLPVLKLPVSARHVATPPPMYPAVQTTVTVSPVTPVMLFVSA